MVSLADVKCFRLDGTIYVEIPEQAIVKVAGVELPSFQEPPRYFNRETFLNSVASGLLDQLYEIEGGATEPREASFHHFLREVCGLSTPDLLCNEYNGGSEMLTVEGARSGRTDGSILIAIPEQSVIDLASKPIPKLIESTRAIPNRDKFLDEVTANILDRPYMLNGEIVEPREQALHHFILGVCVQSGHWLLEGQELEDDFGEQPILDEQAVARLLSFESLSTIASSLSHMSSEIPEPEFDRYDRLAQSVYVTITELGFLNGAEVCDSAEREAELIRTIASVLRSNADPEFAP